MANKIAREKATDNLMDNLLFKVKFVKEIPVSVTCISCKKVLKRPKQLSCGHRCCERCEKTIVATKDGERHCPIDQEVIEYQFPDVSALTELMHLSCFCMHHGDGCTWKGLLLMLEEHLQECEFRGDLVCQWHSVNCDFVGSKKSLDAHYVKNRTVHNSLFAIKLYDVLEKCHKIRETVLDLSKFSEKLSRLINKSVDFLKTTCLIFDDCSDCIHNNGLNSESFRNWYKVVLSGFDSLITNESLYGKSKVKSLLQNIKIQVQQLDDLLKNIPDYEDLTSTKNRILEKIVALEKTSKHHQKQLSDTDLKIRLFQASSYTGTYLWKLDNLKHRMLESSNGRVSELYTPPLYTDQYGYKYSAKVLLYGDPKDRGVSIEHDHYIAFYVIIMKGEYDDILKFPFPFPIGVTLRNLSNNNDVKRRIVPDERVFFQRPFEDMNPSIGFSKFISHDQLHSEGFVVDDAIYIEINVEKDFVT